MSVVIREMNAKSILSKSGIPGADYCLNPYVGCFHRCRYCYATFMKRFTGHAEPWGSFVDIKTNAPELLRRQLKRTARGSVMISSVTDAYQPLEAKYRLTRRCLEVLLEYQFPVDILTKSPLVVRDVDLIEKFRDIEVGITVTTEDDRIRKVFEPNAPAIRARIQALRKLCERGIRTYAFIGPVLPMDPEALSEEIRPYVQSVLIDRMNYASKTAGIYARMNLNKWLDDDFIYGVTRRLKASLGRKAVIIC